MYARAKSGLGLGRRALDINKVVGEGDLLPDGVVQTTVHDWCGFREKVDITFGVRVEKKVTVGAGRSSNYGRQDDCHAKHWINE